MELSKLNLLNTNRYWNSECVNLTQKLHHVIPDASKTRIGDLFLRTQITNHINSQKHDVEFIDANSKIESDTLRFCKKIRIYPCPEQIVLFNKCLGANRYFYNQANNYIKTTFTNTKKSSFEQTKNS